MSIYLGQVQAVVEKFNEMMLANQVLKTIGATQEDVFSCYTCWASIRS